jgi:putative transposase
VLKIRDKRKLNNYPLDKIKHVRIVRQADGYYVQFVIDWSPEIKSLVSLDENSKAVGLDVGLESFYVDTNGIFEPNPRFHRKAERRVARLNRRLSKKQERSQNRKKAKRKLAVSHLKVSRQRKDHAVKAAWNVVMSNDIVAIEKLAIENMVKNHHLAKAISDAAWGQFRRWVEIYGVRYGKHVLAVPARNTSQTCSRCGELKKEKLKLKDRWFVCEHCGLRIHRDLNAAINILKLALAELEEKKLLSVTSKAKILSTAGHAGSRLSLDVLANVWGDGTSGCLSNRTTKVLSLNQKPSSILEDIESTK